MKRMDRISLGGLTTEYPIWGMVLVLALLMVSPFVSDLIPYGVFAIGLYRIIRYDEKVFAVDYCLLAPFMPLFRTSEGMSLLVWLSLIAALWYLIRDGLKADSALVWLLVLLNYLVIRMQMNISAFVLCFGHLAMLYMILPKQDGASAERATKAFVISLTISSAYALVLRNSWQLRSALGAEGEAIWGSGIMRFQGLFADPNYYMTLLIMGLALLCKLKDSGLIKLWFFLMVGVALAAFGILTYSKTFFLVFLLLCCIFVLWQFWNKKVFRGIFITVIAVAVAGYLLFSEDSPVAVVLSRLLAAKDLSGLTTGRTDVFVQYLEKILDTPFTALLGYGLGADGLRKDPHNLYIEIAYYIGVLGLILCAGFFVAMFREMKAKVPDFKNQNLIAKYLMTLMMAVLYFSLHGMFQEVCYAELFVLLLGLLLVKKPEGGKAVSAPEDDICLPN